MKQRDLLFKLERLGLLLKDQRLNMVISILRVSEETGLNRNTITNLEKGKGQVSSFVIYAEYLGMELNLFRWGKIVDTFKQKKEA